jgi:hypothetical protein
MYTTTVCNVNTATVTIRLQSDAVIHVLNLSKFNTHLKGSIVNDTDETSVNPRSLYRTMDFLGADCIE